MAHGGDVVSGSRVRGKTAQWCMAELVANDAANCGSGFTTEEGKGK